MAETQDVADGIGLTDAAKNERRISRPSGGAGGLIARARGHRRYYAGIIEDQSKDERVIVLAEAPFSHNENDKLTFSFSAVCSKLSLSIDGKPLATADDADFPSGGAGFLIEESSIPALDFEVHPLA
ncbi:hypothetical protein [Rhizobium leguminosarum]|uniref:hypothetical protein n=1 Tax=Rhizobium leguminosarum TaxID=384 RepID=UPI000412D9B0|nr:hypothetical protein [Rhizobium leguminosarum]UIJ83213.1 hypothetical protein LZK78_32595 [Rhizobium leguminosarum]